jgi:NhaC family Na+:H+ antiporter
MIMGYHSDTSFGSVFNGGGLYSMVEVVLIVGISSVYSGIFEDTKMLEDFQSKIDIMVEKVGRFPSMVIVGLVLIGIFCNQTLATIMGNDLMARPYEKSGASNYELASDIQNSIIILSAVVPWSIACSVPLSFMGVGIGALPYAFYLYLLPIIYGLTKLTKWKFYDRTQ